MNERSLRGYLYRTAAEAYDSADKKCKGGLPDRENCSWYHGAWPTLRLLDMVSNPYWHHAFYEPQLKAAISQRGAKNALVLGCADVSTAFLVAQTGRLPTLICDICESPLFWAEKCASEFGFNWKTQVVDVTQAMPSGLFDIIINDAFLTRFSESDRNILLIRIKNILSADGIYLTTVRLANTAPSSAAPYMSISTRKNWFVERAHAKFLEYGGLPGISEDNLLDMLNSYMRSMASHRFRDKEHVTNTFESVGFKIVQADEVIVPGESEESVYVRVAASH